MIHYLLWSNKRGQWWRPGGMGYTDQIEQAGAYTEAEAVEAVKRSALCADRTQVTLMVAAPPGWVPPPAYVVVLGPAPLVEVLTQWFDAMRGPHVTDVDVL